LLDENLKHLGLGDLELSKAIEKLRAIPAAQIVQTIPLIQHWSPTLDDGLLDGLREGDFYIENSWCNYVMIGEMAHDVSNSDHICAVTNPTDRCFTGYNYAFKISR
jgi:hypothetical protein